MLTEEELNHWLLAWMYVLIKVVWVNHIGRREEIAFGFGKKSCRVCKIVGLDSEKCCSVVEGGDQKTKKIQGLTGIWETLLTHESEAKRGLLVTEASVSPAYHGRGKRGYGNKLQPPWAFPEFQRADNQRTQKCAETKKSSQARQNNSLAVEQGQGHLIPPQGLQIIS